TGGQACCYLPCGVSSTRREAIFQTSPSFFITNNSGIAVPSEYEHVPSTRATLDVINRVVRPRIVGVCIFMSASPHGSCEIATVYPFGLRSWSSAAGASESAVKYPVGLETPFSDEMVRSIAERSAGSSLQALTANISDNSKAARTFKKSIVPNPFNIQRSRSYSWAVLILDDFTPRPSSCARDAKSGCVSRWRML